MSVDDAAKEKQFIESLPAETGRSLAEWMSAIEESPASERNDIIDWLRYAGFTFAKASWLERIYHNKGVPIYLDDSTGNPPTSSSKRNAPDETNSNSPPTQSLKPKPETLRVISSNTINQTVSESSKERSIPTLKVVGETRRSQTDDQTGKADTTALDDLLKSAKAYRPLAQFLMRELERHLPKIQFHVEGTYVVLRQPKAFGLIAIGAKGLQVALNLEETEHDPIWKPVGSGSGKMRIPAQFSHLNITHSCFLTDAREIADPLFSQIIYASTRTKV